MDFKKIISVAAMAAILLGGTARLFAQTYVPAEENLRAREEFQDDKFGIFIHWGLYCMLAQGEWHMNSGLDYKEYEKLSSGFYPIRFDAAKWVSDIKAGGAKYICITSRHHEGFSMFHTDYSDYNIVDATPFGRDVLKELAEECRKQGIKLQFYYSHLDWYREDYPLGRTGRTTGRPTDRQNWDSYYKFMNNQLTELLTNYGPVRAIWFDGVWDQDQNPDFDWHLEEQYKLIHSLQPACLIGNNHHHSPVDGEDFQMFERDLPGENKAGLSGQAISSLPLETCETMNGMWGYKIKDQNYKSSDEIIRLLVKAAGKNANLLLNIGPQPNGELPATAVERLKSVGAWLAANGESIYGTRGGDVPTHPWGVTTRKGDKLYVHILDLQDKALYLPLATDKKVKSVVEFEGKAPVKHKWDKEGILLNFDKVPSGVDYIIEITL